MIVCVKSKIKVLIVSRNRTETQGGVCCDGYEYNTDRLQFRRKLKMDHQTLIEILYYYSCHRCREFFARTYPRGVSVCFCFT